MLFRGQIIASISAFDVGVIVKEPQFFEGRYALHDLQENLIFDWIAGATEWKKSLNIFTIVVNSVMYFPLL